MQWNIENPKSWWSILYDSFELSSNPVGKTSILNINNVDILQAVNTNDMAVNVYSKYEIEVRLNLKSYKLTTYSKTDVDVFFIYLTSSYKYAWFN